MIGAEAELSAGRLLWALATTIFACIPLAVSAWALLDAAHRPGWAWALTRHRRVAWLAAIGFGVLTVVGGLLVSAWYLSRVRPVVRSAERGEMLGS